MYLCNLPKKSGPDSSRETWLVWAARMPPEFRGAVICKLAPLAGRVCRAVVKRKQQERAVPALWDAGARGGKALVVPASLVELLGKKD